MKTITVNKEQLHEAMRSHLPNFVKTGNMIAYHIRVFKDLEQHTEAIGKILIQTLKEDQEVLFNLKGLEHDWVEDDKKDLDHVFKDKEMGINISCKILCLATYTELGQRDFEYYDIQFEDGYIMYAISGYHLRLENEELN